MDAGPDILSGAGVVAALGGAITFAVSWGAKVLVQKLRLDPSSAANDANSQAQKDMLDWQRDQLKEEVARREKAEDQVQTLMDKLNEVTAQMTRMETQNQKLQDQVEALTKTVDQLKIQLAGVHT